MLPFVKKAFNAKKTWRKAAFSITALNRMSTLAAGGGGGGLKDDVRKHMEESEREHMETASVMYRHLDSSESTKDELADKLDKVTIQA